MRDFWKMKETNLMRNIRIEKVTLNIGVGQAGDKLEKAVKLLESITHGKAVRTITMERIPTWGIRPKLPIGTKITLRKNKAGELLARLFKAIGNSIPASKFDSTGNFAFGIKEYIDIHGVDYNPEIGIIGLDVAVTLTRPGYRVKLRRAKQARIPSRHRITKEDAIKFVKDKFNINIVSED